MAASRPRLRRHHADAAQELRRLSPSASERLLSAPPLRAILQLAAPTSAVMMLGATSGVLHTYFVSRLGGDAIAAVSLVFPINLILMTMMGGGIGAGVSAAIAQALGSGRPDRAESVAEHAFVLTVLLAATLSIGLVLGSPRLFRLMGGSGEMLAGATLFARVLFGGSLITFVVSTFDSILRGEGNVRVPSICATLSLGLQIALTPLFMFPLGMGLAGAAAATITGQAIGALPRLYYLYGGGRAIRMRLLPLRLSADPLRDILRVGVPASLATLGNYLGLLALTAVVARYGTNDIAAFGLGTRLDFVIITLAFGVGSAVLTLVGMAAGAGDLRRVRAVVIRSLAVVIGALTLLAVGLVLRPEAWLHIFTRDPEIIRVGSLYLRAMAPSYPFVGAAMVASFAFQALGRAVVPLVLVVARTALVVSGALGMAAVGAPAGAVFILMALGNAASSSILLWRLRSLLRSA